MGITIHYSGRAMNWDALSRVLDIAQTFSAEREWGFAIWDDPLGVMDDRDKDDPGFIEYDGPFRGIVIRAHPKCEPLRLAFDSANELTPAATKTQFAPFEIHADLVTLLRAIAPFMERLEVVDEAELWETGDESAARAKFGALSRIMESLTDELEDHGLNVDGPGVNMSPAKDPHDPDSLPYG